MFCRKQVVLVVHFIVKMDSCSELLQCIDVSSVDGGAHIFSVKLKGR